MDILNELSNYELGRYFSNLKKVDKTTYVKIGFSTYENDHFCYSGGISAFIESIWDMSNKELIDLMKDYFEERQEKPKRYTIDDAVEFFSDVIENDLLNAFSVWYDIDFKTIYTANFKYGNFDGIFSTLPIEDKVKLLSSIYTDFKITNETASDELLDMCWENVKVDDKKKVLKMFIENITY